jgi:restriction system protein
VTDPTEALRQLRAQVDAGESPVVSVRELLRWYGSPRLTLSLRWQVREQLAAVGLLVLPSLDDAALDTVLTVRRDGLASAVPAPHAAAPHPQRAVAPPPTPTRSDVTIRLADLRDCLERAVILPPEAPLSRAASLLATEEVTCLVVASGLRAPKGVITWERVGRAALAAPANATVGAWTRPVDVLDDRTALFDAIDGVERDGAVVVTAHDRTITAVLTASAAARALRQVAAPFVLLDEIERRLRERIAQRAPNVLQSQSAPSFGDYLRALEDPSVYPRLGLGVDRDVLRDLVDTARLVRNRCMHFAPEGLDADDLRALGRLLNFLRDVR